MRFPVACLALLFAASPALAGIVRFGGTVGYSLVPSSDPGPSSREAAAASIEQTVEAARSQLNRLYNTLACQLNAAPAVVAARLEAARTHTDYENANATALIALHNSPKWLVQSAEITRLERALDDAREEAKSQGTDRTEKINSIAADLLVARSARTRSETAVLKSDESVTRARYAQLDAAARLAEAEDGVRQQLRGNGSWQAAKSGVEAARSQFASLRD